MRTRDLKYTGIFRFPWDKFLLFLEIVLHQLCFHIYPVIDLLFFLTKLKRPHFLKVTNSTRSQDKCYCLLLFSITTDFCIREKWKYLLQFFLHRAKKDAGWGGRAHAIPLSSVFQVPVYLGHKGIAPLLCSQGGWNWEICLLTF